MFDVAWDSFPDGMKICPIQSGQTLVLCNQSNCNVACLVNPSLLSWGVNRIKMRLGKKDATTAVCIIVHRR